LPPPPPPPPRSRSRSPLPPPSYEVFLTGPELAAMSEEQVRSKFLVYGPIDFTTRGFKTKDHWHARVKFSTRDGYDTCIQNSQLDFGIFSQRHRNRN
jgi:hypothetical protein